MKGTPVIVLYNEPFQEMHWTMIVGLISPNSSSTSDLGDYKSFLPTIMNELKRVLASLEIRLRPSDVDRRSLRGPFVHACLCR